MAKPKIRFVCQSCGYVTAKWLGKCPECGQWDSFVEEMDVPERPGQSYLPVGETAKPKPLHQVAEQSLSRLQTGIREFDRVLGGGIVPGSLVLLGGDPGIGKSTMLLDAGMKFSRNNIKVLYVSGEESGAQTAMRARRLGSSGENLLVMTATDLNIILLQAQEVQPALLVIDSIQTMYNSELPTAAGSVGQVRECRRNCCVLQKPAALPCLLSVM